MNPRYKDNLSRGFNAGNYANAYESTDLNKALSKIGVDGVNGLYDNLAQLGYNLAFIVGFFSNYEYYEIPEQYKAIYDEAFNAVGPQLSATGITV